MGLFQCIRKYAQSSNSSGLLNTDLSEFRVFTILDSISLKYYYLDFLDLGFTD